MKKEVIITIFLTVGESKIEPSNEMQNKTCKTQNTNQEIQNKTCETRNAKLKASTKNNNTYLNE
jgi:hypothetical protein